MDSYFDHVAAQYDKEFTHTEIGKRQRSMVHSFLEDRLASFSSVFEVNCGTGEDALWFAQKGKSVVATDIAAEMIRVAEKKAAQRSITGVEFRQLDVTALNGFPIGQQYELVFSNFGGLNCLGPEQLKNFLLEIKSSLLHPDGRIIMVLMSKGSIWESLLYLKRMQFRKAFRRFTNKALEVNVNGKTVPTYYFNPSFFRSLKHDFKITAVQTVGFFLPPSYLELIFEKRPRLLDYLFRMEQRIRKLSFLAGFSDHYLIELKPL